MKDFLINGRFLTRRPTGVDRFAAETLRGFAALGDDAGTGVVVVPRRATIPEDRLLPGTTQFRYGLTQGHVWEQLDLSRLHPDKTLLSLCNTGPIARSNHLAVIHDAAIFDTPDNYGTSFRIWYRVLLSGLARNCRWLTTVSRFSADRLAHHLGIAASRLQVVPESGEHIRRRPADGRILERLGLVDRTFVLTVGSASRNKNVKAVLEAMSSIQDRSVPLVVAGGSDQRVFAPRGELRSGALTTGYLEDSELRALYEHAACFVFPSLYEGFGLPPLEAMCCGCPVLASDRASLPEVCDNAALYFDPTDPSELAALLSRVLASPALRRDLTEAGRQRAATFRWIDTAGSLASIIGDA